MQSAGQIRATMSDAVDSFTVAMRGDKSVQKKLANGYEFNNVKCNVHHLAIADLVSS